MWQGNERILLQVFSIEKITDVFSIEKVTGVLSSNPNLCLHTKLISVLKKEDWQSMK